MQVNHGSKSKSKAVEKAIKKTNAGACSYHFKKGGVVTESSRAMVHNLVQFGVPVEHVSDMIRAVTECLGITTEDDISLRSIGRMVLEGGIMSQVQVAEEIHVAKSRSELKA
jgi:hypothetical protein